MTIAPTASPRTRSADEEKCVFNGIDGATGDYLLPPLSPRQLADLARSEPRYTLPDERGGPEAASGARPVPPWIDVRDLGQCGWGVIFSPAVPPAVREALAPLLEWRQSQADRLAQQRYRAMDYQPGESKAAFLARHGVAPGAATPDAMPYYLLLVGDPEEVPFEFQYQLDVQYAVGRLHLGAPEEYARYAETVVAAERGTVRRPAAAAFFGPCHGGDRATELSSAQLAAPLAAALAGELPSWSIQTALAERATKTRLAGLLAGDAAPALLFTAGHGLCFHAGDPRQEDMQGSLLCQEWPGPGHAISGDHVFAGRDVAASARIAGMIAFHFSCYGAGTPRRDAFPQPLHGQRELAPRAFLSQLSRRLLGHPAGGALAVVGHVDRAWSWSFADLGGREPALRPVFENTLKSLAMGYPIGYAMEFFNSCYAELASDLDDELRRTDAGREGRIAELWTSRNDARNYAVLGDPAVRLAAPLPGT
jgi:hypothetical protein